MSLPEQGDEVFPQKWDELESEFNGRDARRSVFAWSIDLSRSRSSGEEP